MVKGLETRPTPDWDRLYQQAESQAGHFTLAEAEACGYSSQHLQKHLKAGRIARVRRGIYRLTRFPPTEHEELVVLWLWSNREGVFSHETSLALHDLSDALPARVHMTLPTSWRTRRVRVPDGLVLHYEDLPDASCDWFELVPVTTPMQFLTECIEARVSPELIGQAIRQARQLGLISSKDATHLSKQLKNAQANPS